MDTEISTSWLGPTIPMETGDVAFIASPRSKTKAYPDHVQTPAFLTRHVLVKGAPGAKVVPSGMVTSRTNFARSHTAVADAAAVGVGGEMIGGRVGVLVAGGGGRVGVLNCTARVNCASTVHAACVKIASASLVGVPEGMLQADRVNIAAINIETFRMKLHILFSSYSNKIRLDHVSGNASNSLPCDVRFVRVLVAMTILHEYRRTHVSDCSAWNGYVRIASSPYMENNVSFISKPFDPAQGKPAHATPLTPRRRGLLVGASDGLGAALARKLAREGYTLALLARREDKLESLCNEINAGTGNARYYVHDVRQYNEVPALLRKIVADLGGLDLVIYAAGVNFPPGGIDKYNFENDRKMIEVNLIGAMAWLTPVAEMFQSAKAGQIVGISSIAGDRGRVGNPGYNASKAGLATYLEALRNRLTRHGVNVLTVKPGFMKTEMLKAALGATPFTIPPEKAADDIYNAMKKRKQQIYTASIWRWIMLAIQHTPSFIFRRLTF
jgi:decaprenylphospho-beta-D-erythro-pentofuranosid-2-ulose 2-reductase